MSETLYLKSTEKDIAKYVLFSGDPWRVEVLIKKLDNPVQIAFAREFNTYTGTYKGVPITVTSTGIGAPSAAIAVEEMYQCGMEVAVRMGTVMGLRDDMLGKMFIPTACMRDESTSETYVRKSYPAVADFDLISCMEESSKMIGRDTVKGISCTMDGFYSQMKDSKFSLQQNKNHNKTFEELKSLNVLGADMES
ncbi:MAG: nucleoside phosphorylase, partial [Clostridia bacterium]